MWLMAFFLIGEVASAASPVVIIEAENFTSETGGAVRKAGFRPGTSGNFCVAGMIAPGHSLKWSVEIPDEGEYQVVLRYAAGRSWDVLREMKIDGVSPGKDFDRIVLASTGGFGSNAAHWKNKVIEDVARKPALVRLSRGLHVLQLTSLGALDSDDGSANLDLIALVKKGANVEDTLAFDLSRQAITRINVDVPALANSLVAAELRTYTFSSAVLRKTLPYNVFLPKSYSSKNHYPVLYLLHGYGRNHDEWLPELGLAKRAEILMAEGKIPPMVIVTPAIENSFGINSGDDVKQVNADRVGGGFYQAAQGQYEDYFVKEFIPFIESTFNVGGDRKSRRLGGVSMGGFAALHTAFRNPQLFAVVGAHSPSLADPGTRRDAYFYPTTEALEQRHPLYLARTVNLDGMKVWLDCGNKDLLLPGSQVLGAELTGRRANVQLHVWPGIHEQPYWRSHLDEYLLFYSQGL